MSFSGHRGGRRPWRGSSAFQPSQGPIRTRPAPPLGTLLQALTPEKCIKGKNDIPEKVGITKAKFLLKRDRSLGCSSQGKSFKSSPTHLHARALTHRAVHRYQRDTPWKAFVCTSKCSPVPHKECCNWGIRSRRYTAPATSAYADAASLHNTSNERVCLRLSRCLSNARSEARKLKGSNAFSYQSWHWNTCCNQSAYSVNLLAVSLVLTDQQIAKPLTDQYINRPKT
jgi:hypothetical protein